MTRTPPNPPAAPQGFPFSPQDAMDFMQKIWNPLGIPIPGLTPVPAADPAAAGPAAMPFPNPAAILASIDPAEIQRRIDELKIVENWLTMNVSLIQMSIKTMELQKASLEALRAPKPAVAPVAGAEPGRKKP
jgi:hypothetical protein